MLAVENLTKHFHAADGGVTALERLSLEVPRGRFVAVIGPSGCGKSTLFNIVGGLVDGYEGRVTIDGKTVAGVHRDVGMVFQEESTFPWLTTLENVAFPLDVAGVPKAERLAHARKLLRLVGLGDRVGRKLMIVRSMLAIALYRCGRQGDALATTRRARAVLVRELGVSPGPLLTRTEKALLSQDPSLELPHAPQPTTGNGAGGSSRPTCPYKGLAAYGTEDALRRCRLTPSIPSCGASALAWARSPSRGFLEMSPRFATPWIPL